MRQTSALYNQLRSQTGTYYEVQVIRDPDGEFVIYGMDKLKSIEIMPALFQGNGPQVGGTNSAQCNIKIVEDTVNWPRAASFEVRVRLTDGTDEEGHYSEWLSMGVYYTDERTFDKYGNLSIIGFDGMLLLEQSWTDKVEELPSSWPITAHTAAELLEEAVGIVFDERTIFDNSTPFIGLNTKSTARDVLSLIAAGMGGNWQMTADRKLYLVPLQDRIAGISAVAGVAIAGMSIVGMEETPEPVTANAIAGMSVVGETVVGFYNPVILGKNVTDFRESQGLPAISNIILENDSGQQVRKTLGSGYTLRVNCDYSDSQIADVCLARTYGYMYYPFEAQGARIDPAAEVGDSVEIDGKLYRIITIKWKIGPRITADLSAPYEETVDHEYTFISESAKALRKSMSYTDGLIESARSYIEQTAESIQMGVQETYVSNANLNTVLQNYSPTEEIESRHYTKEESDEKADALASEISLTDSRLTLAFTELRTDTNDAINAMSYYIRYEGGVVIVGRTDSPTSIRISNEQIGLYYNNEAVSWWNQNKQYTPHELEIPAGGKFTLGSILFQPRTSGNMSLMWVGGGN